MGTGRVIFVSRRGTIAVAVLVALVVLSLVVAAAVTGGARDQQLTRVRVQGARAQAAADSAAAMAVKEMMDGADLDGDGVIGTISNDSNTATDPTINSGTRMWATSSVSGSVTTITARGQNADAARAVRVAVRSTGGTGTLATAGTVLLVVQNSAAMDSQETAKRGLIQGWGYTVDVISATASQAAFDAAVKTSSVVYISETVLSSDVSTKLTSAPLGVITEESSLSDELGISGSMTTFTGNTVDIINNSHYITSTLSTGTQTLFTAGQPVRYLSGSLGSFTTLGRQVSTTNPTFVVMERGDTLTPSGAAAGRRVYLPWGNTGVDINALTAAGLTIMKRSIEWCLLPVAYYALDDGSGTTAVDSISGRNGTLNGPAWGTGTVSGALQFGGVNDYVSIADHAAFQVTGAMTIAGWIKGTTWPNNSDWASIILRKGDSNPNNWELEVNLGKVVMVLDDYDAYGIRGNTTLANNAWYHVAGTWDGEYVRVYVNGVLDNTPTARAAPIGTDTRDVYLGGRILSTDVTDGMVDDVRFYSRALTAAEIAALANMSSSVKRLTSVTAVQP